MAKTATNRFRVLDVRWLQRQQYLEPGESITQYFHDRRIGPAVVRIDVRDGYLVLAYTVRIHGLEPYQIESLVPLNWSNCHFGGRRPWFVCPNPECRRRVAMLYGNGVFACRRCHDLAYECQKESGEDRALRRSNKIRCRLGWRPGTLNPPGFHVDPAWAWHKPKGMHRSTYRRLVEAHNAFAYRSICGVGERVTRVLKKVAKIERQFSSD